MDMLAELKAAKDEAVDLKAKLAEAQTAIAEGVKAVESMKADIAKAKADQDEASKTMAAIADQHGKQIAALNVEKAELAKQLAEAKHSLAHPAFAAASVKGDKAPAPEGSAVAVDHADEPKTTDEAKKAYHAIPPSNAKARAEFREKYADLLGLSKHIKK